MDREQLKKIPKTELHVHIEALMREQTLKELAMKYNLGTFHIDLLRQSIKNGYSNLEDFFKNWHFLNASLQKSEDFERITYEYLQETAAFNTKYVELNINIMRQIEKGLDPKEVIYAINRAQMQAECDFGIISRTLLSYSRDFSIADGKMIVDMADDLRHFNVGGIDIAGNEKLKPNKNYIQVFTYAKKRNVRRTAHAGEGTMQNSIVDAVNHMEVSRIGHGVDAIFDTGVMQLLRDRQICVELCVSCNVAIGTVHDFTEHPGKAFIEAGIPVTFSTDDPALLGISLLDEYERVVNLWNLTEDDLLKVYQTGVQHAFVNKEIKQVLKNVA